MGKPGNREGQTLMASGGHLAAASVPLVESVTQEHPIHPKTLTGWIKRPKEVESGQRITGRPRRNLPKRLLSHVWKMNMRKIFH